MPQEPITLPWRVGLALLGLVPFTFVVVGLVLLKRMLLAMLGREYARVSAHTLERGVRWGGRAWSVKRHPLAAVENVRAGSGLEIFDGGKPHSIGFTNFPAAHLNWLADALAWAARDRAPPPSRAQGAPAGWPHHARIRVEEAGGEVRILAGGVHWPWLVGLTAGALPFLAFGLAGTVALPYLTLTQLAGEPLALRLFALAFTGVPGAFVYFGARTLYGAWLAFALGSSVHTVRKGEITLDVPGAKTRTRVELARVKKVKIDHGNVVLATETEDVTLGFHRLRNAEDLAWARDAIAYAIRKYGGVDPANL